MAPLEAIVVQLRKWDRKGYLKNHPRPDLRPYPRVKVDRIEVDTRHGKTCVFESSAMHLLAGQAVEESIAYADVSRAVWMSHDVAEKVRLKATPDFDRLIVERFDGTSVTIDGLEQAVFPLLSAFRWIGQNNTASRQALQP